MVDLFQYVVLVCECSLIRYLLKLGIYNLMLLLFLQTKTTGIENNLYLHLSVKNEIKYGLLQISGTKQ
jgi:hypothetical protein